jgi:hypothetical protein
MGLSNKFLSKYRIALGLFCIIVSVLGLLQSRSASGLLATPIGSSGSVKVAGQIDSDLNFGLNLALKTYTCGRKRPADTEHYNGGWLDYDVAARRKMYPEDFVGYHGKQRIYTRDVIQDTKCKKLMEKDVELKPLDHIAQCSPDEMLYGTKTAQHIIHRHQNPIDPDHSCAEKNFMFFTIPSHGLGSIWHITTAFMAIAMEHDRILIPANSPSCDFDNSDGTNFYDCYFEEMSSCTTWAREHVTHQLCKGAEFEGYGCLPHLSKEQDHRDQQFTFFTFYILDNVAQLSYTIVPYQFAPLLACSPISDADSFYWWRAQAVAYLLRPDSFARAEIDARIQAYYKERRQLPAHSVALHIRRGDKEKELKSLTSDESFVRALNASILSVDWTRMHGIPKAKHIFVSTEDKGSLDYVVNAFANVDDVQVSYATVPRHSSKSSPMEIAKKIGPQNEVFNSLLNLRLSLQAHSVMGIFGSNWVRLIDELRSTIGCHSSGLMIDPSQPDWLNGYSLEW